MTFFIFLGYVIFFSVVGRSIDYAKENGAGGFFKLGFVLLLIGSSGFFLSVTTGSGSLNDLNKVIFKGVLALFVFSPMAIAGAGLIAAALIRKFQGRFRAQFAILCLFAFVPLVAGFAITKVHDLKAQNEEQEKAEFRAAMQLTNVSGTFGGEHVTIPLSPQVSFSTRCDVPSGVSGRICDFDNRFELFSGFGSTTLDFEFVLISIPDCELNSCTSLKSWCERRTDLKDSVWCLTGHRARIQLRTDRAHPREEDTNRPLFAQSSPVEGLRIRCGGNVKKAFCQAHFEVAPGVRTKLIVENIEPGNEENKIREIKTYAERLWSEMTSAK